MIRALPFAFALLLPALPAIAQPPSDPSLLQPIDPDDPVEKLGRYLRVLSASPRDLEALTGAGRAALDVGDANAAIGFYGRAEEIAPRDGRIKAGLASALVQMEQPKEALKLFDQAVDLGMPVAAIAEDRGLAYDLRGDNRRAQADYALALRSHHDDETVRRLALSQAMSGDRAGAMATLDPLLRKQDKAAWRASTFVLALTGDAKGAVDRLGLLMAPSQAEAIAPFLGRLAALKPGEQAQAVHFGHLPSDGRSAAGTALASATPTQPASGADRSLVPSGQALGTPTRSTFADAFAATTPASRAPRRRPGYDPVAAEPAAAASRPSPTPPVRTQLAAATPVRSSAPLVTTTVRGTPAASTPQTAIKVADTVPVRSLPPVAPSTPDSTTPTQHPSEMIASTATAPVDVARPAGVAAARGLVGPVDPSAPPASAAVEAGPPASEAATVSSPPTRVRVEAPAPVRIARAEQPTLVQPAAAKTAPAPKPQPDETAPARTRRAAAGPAEPGTERAEIAKIKATGSTERTRGTRRVEAEAEATKGKRDADTQVADTKAEKAKRAAETAKADKAKRLADAQAEKAKRAAADAKAEKAKLAAATRQEPQRYWVQVATGANKADLPKAWAKVKAQYPQLMAGKSPWTTPLRFTNRLLVGPFRSDDDAQAFVNNAGKAGFGTSPFASTAGQKIERIAGK